VKRKFLTNLILVIVLNLLVKPFWIFGIDRTVQNVVGADQYGFYFSLLSFSLLLNILLDIGITNFNNRAIAQEPKLLNEYFSNIIVLKFLLAVFYAFVCLAAGLLIGYNSAQFRMLIMLIINQFLASFLLYLRSNISGLQYFRTDSIISVLDRTIVIIICGVLLWGNITDREFRIEWFIYAQTAAYLITVAIAFLIVISKTEFLRPRFDLKYFTSILKKSYPFALLILLMSFYNRIDSVMLERLLPDGKTEAGIYAQSFRILDAASMFAFLFAGLLLPIFSRMIKQEDPLNDMVTLSFKLILIPAIILACITVFYSQYIIEWMYNEHVYYSSRIFPLLMLGFISISMTYIFGTLLTANGNLKELNILAGSALVMNIILNFLLIPRYKAWGAAVSSLITQSYMALAQVFIAMNKFKFSFDWRLFIRLGSFTGAIFIFGWFSRTYIPYWWAGVLALGAISLLCSFLIGLLKIKDLYRIVRFGDENRELRTEN
jgi:O-antigen/teichoic acid export membrane protein